MPETVFGGTGPGGGPGGHLQMAPEDLHSPEMLKLPREDPPEIGGFDLYKIMTCAEIVYVLGSHPDEELELKTVKLQSFSSRC